MARTLVSRLACLTLIGCLAIAVSSASLVSAAEDKAPEKKTEKKADKDKSKKKKAKKGHRLPPHYKDVVNDEQRARIYGIQDEYGPKIKALQRQLKALKKEQKERIEAVLTPDQKEKVDAAKSSRAKSRRKAVKGKPKKQTAKAPEKPADKPK